MIWMNDDEWMNDELMNEWWWMNDWLIDWLVGWFGLVGWLLGWWFGWWLVGWVVGWLVGLGWLVGWWVWVGWLVGWWVWVGWKIGFQNTPTALSAVMWKKLILNSGHCLIHELTWKSSKQAQHVLKALRSHSVYSLWGNQPTKGLLRLVSAH